MGMGATDGISDFDLLTVRTDITDVKALAEWFIKGLDKDISLQLVLSGILDTTKSMQHIYVKTFQIMRHFYKADTIRKTPRAPYGGNHSRRDPNAMDVDRLTISLVEHARLMHKHRCFIRKKMGCSSRNHPGHPRYNTNQGGKTYSQGKDAMARAVNTNPTPSSSQTHTNDKLEAYITNLQARTDGLGKRDQILRTLKSIYDKDADEEGFPFDPDKLAAADWDEQINILNVDNPLNDPAPGASF